MRNLPLTTMSALSPVVVDMSSGSMEWTPSTNNDTPSYAASDHHLLH
jgi:hypothetical protein